MTDECLQKIINRIKEEAGEDGEDSHDCHLKDKDHHNLQVPAQPEPIIPGPGYRKQQDERKVHFKDDVVAREFASRTSIMSQEY